MQNNCEGTRSRSEEALVRQAQAGDQDAFGELMRRHYTASLKTAISILRVREEAEDEVQNAYWKAYQYVGQFQGDAQFSTWLTRIVVNQCLMRLRQARRARFVYLEDADLGRLEPLAEEESPEQALGRKEVAALLMREIRRIPPLWRNAFVLRDVRENSVEQAAAKLGISDGAVKSRLLRARQELRKRLTAHAGRRGPAALTA
ncbi:MAG TPA: sigma-70 family RNA polymerase sigma factor [Bryobacteraceae bacterium]|nr:sigma-70 family RNA polymerase sigma factor [Bryobacteraceae bacterium]